MTTKTKKPPAAATPPDPPVVLVQSSTPQELAPPETMGEQVAEVEHTNAATEFSPTAPTTESGHETSENISKIVAYWVDQAERWLWKTPKQAMLHGDYETFLAELKKKL